MCTGYWELMSLPMWLKAGEADDLATSSRIGTFMCRTAVWHAGVAYFRMQLR